MQREERASVTLSTKLDSGLASSGTKIDSAIDNLLKLDYICAACC
jgi:hypothetical protein